MSYREVFTRHPGEKSNSEASSPVAYQRAAPEPARAPRRRPFPSEMPGGGCSQAAGEQVLYVALVKEDVGEGHARRKLHGQALQPGRRLAGKLRRAVAVHVQVVQRKGLHPSQRKAKKINSRAR